MKKFILAIALLLFACEQKRTIHTKNGDLEVSDDEAEAMIKDICKSTEKYITKKSCREYIFCRWDYKTEKECSGLLKPRK